MPSPTPSLSVACSLLFAVACGGVEPPPSAAAAASTPSSKEAPLVFRAEASGSTDFLTDVWGSGPHDVYAVGASGTLLHSRGDGAWSALPGAIGGDLLALWGSGPRDLYVVGNDCRAGTCDGLILHSTDGAASFSRTVVAGVFLSSVWGARASDVYVGGAEVVLRSVDGGASWQRTATPVDETRVWGSDGGHLVAAGGYAFVRVARSTDGGASWDMRVAEHLPQSGGVRGLWGSGPGDIWAVGSRGYGSPIALHSRDDGRTWEPLAVGVEAGLGGVWGSGPNDVYLVGSDGLLLHTTDGGHGFDVLPAARATLCAVWGSGPGDVYTVGADGLILHGHR